MIAVVAINQSEGPGVPASKVGIHELEPSESDEIWWCNLEPVESGDSAARLEKTKNEEKMKKELEEQLRCHVSRGKKKS